MNKKIFAIIFTIFILWIVNNPINAHQETTSTKPEGFDYTSVINKYQQLIPQLIHENKIPGMSVALINRDGVIWVRGFGHRDDTKEEMINDQTLFSIQSMSKTFTATAVLLAVQQGLVHLDKPIISYLPRFRINSVFEDNPEQKITLRLLLSHRSGLGHEAPVGNNYDRYTGTFEDHIRSISATWLKFKVGERYSYSNLGIDLAGYILQEVSGQPFAVYVKDKLLTPLHMVRSTFDINIVANEENRATGHHPFFKKIPLKIPMIPAGGLYTNARELANFVSFHLNWGKHQGTEILKESLLEEMYRIPTPRSDYNYGYGLGIVKMLQKGSYSFTHSGGGFGFNSSMKWYPQFNIGVVILANSICGDVVINLCDNFLDDILQKRRIVRGLLSDIATIDRICGRYRIKIHGQPLMMVDIKRGGDSLILKNPSMGSFRLFEYKPGVFFSEDGDSLDTRGDILLWRNIHLEKINIHPVELKMVLICMAVLALIFLTWLLAAIVIKIKKSQDEDEDEPRKARFIYAISMVHSFIITGYTAVILNFATFIIYSGIPIHSRMPWWLKAVIIVPLIFPCFALIELLTTIVAWKKKFWHPIERILYSVATLATILLTILLTRWNLIIFPG